MHPAIYGGKLVEPASLVYLPSKDTALLIRAIPEHTLPKYSPAPNLGVIMIWSHNLVA